MRIEMRMNESLNTQLDWSNKGFNMNREIDNEGIYFELYEEKETVADFLVYVDSSMAVASLERMHLVNKMIDKIQILESFLDYIYNLESPYFRILGVRGHINESGLDDFTLQSVGFFRNSNSAMFIIIYIQILMKHFILGQVTKK